MKKIRYFAYVRKSSEDKERQTLSIPAQIDEIKKHFSDLTIVDVIREERSAFKPFNRPEFDKLIDRIRKGEAEGIIAWHPDRLSRNEIDASTITYMLRTGQIVDLKFGSFYFQNTPEGIWMLQNALTQSQYSSAKLSVDVRRGNSKKLQLGDLPGVAPQGYINVKSFEGRHYIKEDPERFTLVKQMWELLLSGRYGPSEILHIANEEWGYKTIKRAKSGGGPISRSSLYHLFNNPFYAGYIIRKGEEYEGSHEAMITKEQFEQAQKLLGKKGRPRFSKKHNFVYRGYLHCEECGCQITASISKGHIYYYCTRKRKDYACKQSGTIREEELDKQMERLLAGYTILPEFQDWALEVIRSQNETEADQRNSVYEMQHQSVASTQKQIDKLIDMASRDLISEEDFALKSEELKAKLSKLRENLRDTEQRADSWLETIEQTLDFAVNARQRFLEGDFETRRDILLGMGQNPTVYNGKIQITSSEWLAPIHKEYPQLESRYLKVKTAQNADVKVLNPEIVSIKSKWLGWRDSNPRMLVPETSALPLGDIP